MNNIIFKSANELVESIKSEKITVAETVKAFLSQIERHNPTVNAIIDIRKEEDILSEAFEKDEAIKKGEKLGILHGLPLTIKDSFLVKGLKNSNGDPLLRNYIAEEDCELVKRLKQEGAIIIGKTNVPLYCIDWQSTNFWNGQTNNPYDFSRVAGGSSGGSAVSVACGFSPLELGADAGGSLRVPAHFNGICTLRPTENYISNRGHIKVPNKPQGRRHVVTPGPMAKNIDDLILLMRVIGDNKKYRLPELPATDLFHSKWNKEPLKVAISEHINNIEIDIEYLEIFRAFIGKIKNNVKSCEVNHPTYNEKEAYLKYATLTGFEMGVNMPKIPLLQLGMYLFMLVRHKDRIWSKGMAKGQRLSNTNYAKIIDYKDKFSKTYDDFLTKYDIWITPVCPTEAYKHQKIGKEMIINNKKVPYMTAMGSYTFTSAFSGHPIVVIPIGKKKNGMPVGIQIHSRKWSDNRLLEIAKYLENFTTGFETPKKFTTAN